MADIYDRAKSTARRMLAPRSEGGKGAELTLRRITRGEYDPATGGSSEVVQTFVGSGVRENYKQSDIDGTVIRQGDVKLLVSPVLLDGTDTPLPQTQDQVWFDGEQYAVQSVEPWDYAGLVIGFSLQVRK